MAFLHRQLYPCHASEPRAALSIRPFASRAATTSRRNVFGSRATLPLIATLKGLALPLVAQNDVPVSGSAGPWTLRLPEFAAVAVSRPCAAVSTSR